MDVIVPFVTHSDVSNLTFRVARLALYKPDHLTFDPAFVVPLRRSSIDVSAAVYSGNMWWIPGLSTDGAGHVQISILRLRPGGELSEHARIPALTSLLPADAPANMRGRYSPREPRSLLLSNGLILMGYIGDSLFVINSRTTTCKTIFHPIESGLRISDCGSGKILLWKENGRKCYVIDAGS
jgi:hypothetical protein